MVRLSDLIDNRKKSGEPPVAEPTGKRPQEKEPSAPLSADIPQRLVDNQPNPSQRMRLSSAHPVRKQEEPSAQPIKEEVQHNALRESARDESRKVHVSSPASLGAGEKPVLYEDQPRGAYELAALLGIEVPSSRQQNMHNANGCLRTIFEQLKGPESSASPVWPMVTSIASDLEGILQDDRNIATIIQRDRVSGEELISHSLYTAILAMDLAAYSGVQQEASVIEIGGAALLHDCGMLNDAPPFTMLEETHPRYRDHVEHSVALASACGVPERVITIIKQHHERIDGKGFPVGLHGADMLTSSQTLAISDVFELAVINIANLHHQNESAPAGLPEVFAHHGKAYQSQLMKDMIALIGYYPVGSFVKLSNNCMCEVIAQNRNAPLRPVVKVVIDSTGSHPDHTRIIDLQEVPALSVVRAIASTGGST